jgi:altronate hydrolase
MTANRVLRLNAKDNVLVALGDLRAGEQIDFGGRNFVLKTDVPAKHKFATEAIAPGGAVIMYGVLIGKATEAIGVGERVTTRNTHHEAAAFHEKTEEYRWHAPDVSNWLDKTFQGYFRDDGQVGTRNYWLVVPLVFCENRNIGVLKQAFEEELGFAAPPIYRQQVADLVRSYQEGAKPGAREISRAATNGGSNQRERIFEKIGGIKFLLHERGCGGCQQSQTAILREELKKRDRNFSKPLLVFEQQQSGSEFAMLSNAIRKTFDGLVEANKLTRKPAPLSQLCVGLKCGGSDGFSGISANPAIGHTSDLVVALGGRTILSEFPELCGVEQELINRSVQKEVGDRFIQLMRDYAARAKAVRSGFDMNPSPGNIRDGLITDAMKSAGAAKKGGTAPVVAVLDYPEYSTQPGLHLQCTPGNDVECVTAQVGAGANVVLFTTGLGTPTGNPIAPVVKLSTNSALTEKMPDIIDIDTGEVIAGRKSISQMGEEILGRVIQIASGETKTKAELLAQNDFIPWKRGVSL